jgi:hypothetical protein
VIDMIYETLKKLSDNQRKQPSYIFLDETDNKIKEMPLKKLDSAGSYINYKNPAKLIHRFTLGNK